MRYVIIGNGAAGNAAAAAIRARDPKGEVLIFSDEPEAAYYRPLITSLVERDAPQDIFFHPEGENLAKAEVRLGKSIVGLDAGRREISFPDGKTLSYDRLLLATGAAAILPDIPGLAGPGAFVLRSLADAQALAQAAGAAKRAVILGAGRVGLKAALALSHRGLDVTLVEQGSHPAPMQFDDVAGEILGRALEAAGIRLCLGQTVTVVKRDKSRPTGVILADGQVLAAEIVVAAVGVRPRVELAARADLNVNQGVVVDGRLCTSAAEIYAAGDVAETTDIITGQSLVSGLWTNAREMGRVAGSNMAGASLAYPGAFAVLNALEVAGVPTVAMGLTNPPAGADYQVQQSRRGEFYRKLVFHQDLLVGALLVGEVDAAGVYLGFIKGKTPGRQVWEELAHPRSGLASLLAGKARKAPISL